MKRILTITALLLATLTAIFVLSCKKDESKPIEEPQTRGVSTTQFQIPADIDGYLTNFKKQLADPSNNVSMSVEEATWHLAALANYDFGYFNAEHNNILRETLYGHVDVNNDQITLANLATAYADIHETIDDYYQNLELDNKQIHFVNVVIAKDGMIAISLSVTYSDRWYNWFPIDTTYCNNYIYGQGPFWNFGNGMQLLEDLLNLIESHNTDPNIGPSYAVPYTTESPLPQFYIDNHQSPNYLNSRIYCIKQHHYDTIPEDEMCYYLQSYHALGLSFITTINNALDVITSWDIDEDVINWGIVPQSTNDLCHYYHHLTIGYGVLVPSNPGGGRKDK